MWWLPTQIFPLLGLISPQRGAIPLDLACPGVVGGIYWREGYEEQEKRRRMRREGEVRAWRVVVSTKRPCAYDPMFIGCEIDDVQAIHVPM